MKKSLTIIAVIFLIGFAGLGCGDTASSSSGSPDPAPVSAMLAGAAPATSLALAEGLSDFSPADLNAVAVFDPSAPVLPGIDAGPSWRRLLDPRPRLSFGRAMAITQAPADALGYYLDDGNSMPGCATKTLDDTCTDGSTSGACTVWLSFAPGCPMMFNNGKGRGNGNGMGMGNGMGNGNGQGHGSSVKGMSMAGGIQRTWTDTIPESAPGAMDGAWMQTIATTDLMTTHAQTGRWMVINGYVTHTFDGSASAAPYQYREGYSIPPESPATVENDRGDKLAVFGSSQTNVLPGSSAETAYDISIMLLSPGAQTRRIHRQMQQTVSMLGPTTMAMTIHSTNASMSGGGSWDRDGQFTIKQLDETTVMVNGSNVVTGPDGTVYDVRLTDVVFEDGAMAPLSGSAAISIDGLPVSTVTFNGDCQAKAVAADGTTSQLDVCAAGRVRAKMMKP